MDLVQQVEAALTERQPIKESALEMRFLCPAHDDHDPSARWNSEKKTWHCDACKEGGGYVDLAKRLGIEVGRKEGKGKIVATYPYVDEDGELLFQVVRFEPKDFRQRRPEGNGWTWSLKGTRRVLYHLPDVLAAVREGRYVLLVEGEKDADNLVKLGFVATTAPQGAGKWQKTFTESLQGGKVAVIPDRDEAGEKHRDLIRAQLLGNVKELRIVELPSGKDVSDWIATGGTAAELKKLVSGSAVVRADDLGDAEAELERLREENKRLKGEVLVEEDAGRDQILMVLSEQLGVTVSAIVKYASDVSTYEMEVEGQRVQVGGVEKLLEQRPLRLRIADVCGRLINGLPKERWFKVVDLMLRAQEVRKVDESSGHDTLQRWLAAYLSHNPAVRDDDELYDWQTAAAADRPFVRGEKTYINLMGLRGYLKNRYGETQAVKDIAELLTKHGGTSERIWGKITSGDASREFRKRFWVVPMMFLESRTETPELKTAENSMNSEDSLMKGGDSSTNSGGASDGEYDAYHDRDDETYSSVVF